MDVVVAIISSASLFLVALIAAHFISKNKAFSFLQARTQRYGCIDGLRGYLALAVFLHHFVITWYWKVNGWWDRPPEVYFQNAGRVGVALFFMITGFLFISKVLKDAGKTDWLKLFESRFFRIVPLYFFAVVCISVIVFTATNFQLNVSPYELVKQYFKWATFRGYEINGFEDTRLIIAAVDWTLKYEWFFYLSLPVISLFIINGKRFGGACLSLLTILLYIFPITALGMNSIYLIVFTVGGISAYIIKQYPVDYAYFRKTWVSIIAALALCISILHPNTMSITHILCMSIFFVLVVCGNDLFGLLSLRSSVLLGEISYSIYLLHGLVLYLIFSFFNFVDLSVLSLSEAFALMPLIGGLVVVVSVLTFILVEKHGITFGRKYKVSQFLRAKIGYRRK